jgi:Carboxypeptidase regulatory-like domain
VISSGVGLLRIRVWALGLSFAASGFAQHAWAQYTATPETANSTADRNLYNLSGTVINSVTGEPVRRAAVQIFGRDANIALTDTGGHFSLEGIAEGNVYLTAVKPGFYQDEASHTTPVQVAKDAPEIVLKLTPWGVIRGRVTTRDERPLEGMQVRLIAKQNVEGRLVWTDQPNQAVTDDEGEFRITGLQAGTYYVAVDQSPRATLTQKGVPNTREQIFTKQFYPGVSEMSAATPIEVIPGDEAEASFALSAEPIYRVSGSLTGAASAVSNLVFERKAGDQADFTQTVSVQSGKFEAEVPAGSYSVNGQTPDGKELVSPGASVMIRADEPQLVLPLSPAAIIPVQIEREQGGNGSETRLPVSGGMQGMTMQLEPISPFRRGFLRARAEGFANVAPGTYRLQITTSGGWWVKSAQSAGVDLLSDELTVVEGEQPAPIELTMRDGAGIVSGTVTPMGDPGRVIVLLAQAQGSNNVVRTTIAMQGNFTIPGVPPGEYLILALNDGDQLEYANPDVLSPYLSDAGQVTVRARGNVTVNLGLTSVSR